MARMKDFARDIGLDVKEAISLVASYGLGEKQSNGTIEDGEIAIFLNKYTLDNQFKNFEGFIDEYIANVEAEAKAKAEKEAPLFLK